MSSRPAKRARSGTDTDTVDLSTIPELVDTIDPLSIAKLLVTAAQAHPDIASLVKRSAAAKRAEVRNFNYLSSSAWKSLNVRVKDSQAYEFAGIAAQSIEGCSHTIQQGCRKTTNFETKESALEALRKIGKSICLSEGRIGREIQDDIGLNEEFVSTMLSIAESLTEEEKEKMRPWCDDKLVELRGIAHEHSIFEDLDEVIDLWGDEEEEEEEESEGAGYPDGSEEVKGSSGDERI